MAGKGQITSARKRQTRTSQRASQGALPVERPHQGGYYATSGYVCAHPREPLRVTFDHYGVMFHYVTSGQKAPLGRILCNFRLRMRTHKGTPKGSRDLRSLPVAMVLVLLYYIFYDCYKRGGEAGHAQNMLPVRASSGHVTSGHVTDFTFGDVTSGSTTSANIVLSLPIYYSSTFPKDNRFENLIMLSFFNQSQNSNILSYYSMSQLFFLFQKCTEMLVT